MYFGFECLSWGLCVGLFSLLLGCCVVRCFLFCIVCVVVFVLFSLWLLVWLLLLVVAGMVCCIETTKHLKHNSVVAVRMVCLSIVCCVLCIVGVFFVCVGLCVGLFDWFLCCWCVDVFVVLFVLFC